MTPEIHKSPIFFTISYAPVIFPKMQSEFENDFQIYIDKAMKEW